MEIFNLEVPTQSVELREIIFDETDDEYIVIGAIPSIAEPGRMASFHYRYAEVIFFQFSSHLLEYSITNV